MTEYSSTKPYAAGQAFDPDLSNYSLGNDASFTSFTNSSFLFINTTQASGALGSGLGIMLGMIRAGSGTTLTGTYQRVKLEYRQN